MKRPIGKIIFLLFLLLLPLTSWGQKRIYTKSYRMQDFKSKTTRVVLPGPPEFDQALRESITSLWTISPYEFCTKAQFEKQKSNPDLCFLYTETNRGIVYLTLAKGGKTNDTNPLKRPLEIISVPIAGERDSSGQELLYMPVFISIVQDYTDAAMESETAAYSGIGVITHGIPHGITIYTDPAEAAEAFRNRRPASAVRIIITPDGNPASKPRHKMTFSTVDYRLFAYR